MLKKPLTVAWISDFPVEWLPEVPEPLRNSRRRAPATWQMVLLEEFEKDPALRVNVILLRNRIERGFSFERNGAVFHVLKAQPWSRLASVFWADTFLIKRACKRIKPDLVHAWGMETGASLVGHRLGYPYLMTVQGLFSWYLQHVPMRAYERFIERLERRYLPRSPVVTTESTFAVKYLKNLYPHLQIHQAEHAPNRVFFSVSRRPQIQPPHFITIGTLGFRKGTDLLFQALDQLTPQMPFQLTLISASNPGYLQSLKATVSPTLWQRTQFKHHILPHEVARELETPTLLLLPTRADTSPNAVKEAVVAGVPVVASEVGGIPDYVTPGKNGLLFPPGDLSAFIRSIQAACAHPLFSQGQVDPQTLLQVRDYLSPERMAQNFLLAYKAALGQ